MFLLLLACTTPPEAEPSPTAEEGACDAVPTGAVSLPADEAPRDEAVEWWYWTGHLQDDAGRWYGFEEVFFLLAYGGDRYVMAHHAVTDVEADVFAYDAKFQPWDDGDQPETGFAFEVGGWTASGAGGHDVLAGNAGDYALTLDLVGTKAPVLQHGDGYHDYEFGGYTYYYSRTRMDAEGTLTVGGEARAVTGTGWFDRQYGALEDVIASGWDWFAIQLDDGREIMLFFARPNGEPELAGGTVVEADCRVAEIPAEDLTLTATGSWENPDGCAYPSGWEIQVGDLALTVTPVRADQELDGGYERYWEGAATVSGGASGRAYVELAGYCR